MPTITNVSKNTLLIGRFKLIPGMSLPVIPYTVKEKADIDHFVKLGRLMVKEPVRTEPEQEAPKPVVVEEIVAAVAEEPVAEPVEQEQPAEESKHDKKRKNKKAE